MTTEALKRYTLKDLAVLAKKRGVRGWKEMRKDQLVRALSKPRVTPSAKAARKSTKVVRRASRPLARASSNGARHVVKPKSAAVRQRIERVKARSDQLKNLASKPSNGRHVVRKDRLVVLVRDPFWLHAYWELTRHGVARAEAAMGQDWHTARPVLRLLEVSDSGTTNSAEAVVRHIDIHGGVSNWYIDVQDPPKSYRVEIGYLASGGRFFVLARSNVVATPPAGASDAIDENWTDVAHNCDKIYAMSAGRTPSGASSELAELFEERLRRPMGSTMVSPANSAIDGLGIHRRGLNFQLDAELIVFGRTQPDARVTLQGDPVRLRSDGTFTVRFSMPNCRQVIPAVAISADGIEQQTIVLAVERNTKAMEPLFRDGSE